METYRVSFVGHREIFRLDRLTDLFEWFIRYILKTKEYVEFYIGRNGDFDRWVSYIVKRIKKETGYGNCSLILVLPYGGKAEKNYEGLYDEVKKPLDENTHYKIAITKRNEWLVDNSDLLICYVENEMGGAYTTKLYAEKKGVKIINFAKIGWR